MTDAPAAALPLAHVFPRTAALNGAGHLAIGGCDALDLAREFGTPLYVYDLDTVRAQATAITAAFTALHPATRVLYASKAFLSRPFARLVASLGLGFDVVSGGEIEVLDVAGVDLSTAYFHGNNKSPAELALAVDRGVGRVVIDNEEEIDLLDRIAGAAGRVQPVLLRVSPGVDGHTHEKTTTGILDSKFGLPIATGAAERAARAAADAPHLDFRGLHVHIGSPIFELEPYALAMEVMAAFIDEVCGRRLGVGVAEFSPGGGFAVAYRGEQMPPEPAAYAAAIVGTLAREAAARGFPMPDLTIEPGRSLVARAGVALYTVGARKEIPGVRTYVSVDGGMADNVRPAMYGAPYEIRSAERPLAEPDETVTIAGKYCESGDLLVRDARVPRFARGEVVAIPAAGAYQLAMSSNYNLAYRPAVVLVADGRATLIRRRETVADLLACDVDPAEVPWSP